MSYRTAPGMVGQTPISRAIRNYQLQREQLSRPASRNESYNPPRGTNPNPIFGRLPPFKESFTKKSCVITIVIVIIVIILVVAVFFCMKRKPAEPVANMESVTYPTIDEPEPYVPPTPSTSAAKLDGGNTAQDEQVEIGDPDDEYITGGCGGGFMI